MVRQTLTPAYAGASYQYSPVRWRRPRGHRGRASKRKPLLVRMQLGLLTERVFDLTPHASATEALATVRLLQQAAYPACVAASGPTTLSSLTPCPGRSLRRFCVTSKFRVRVHACAALVPSGLAFQAVHLE